MEITVFGRTIRFFTAEQIKKLMGLIFVTIGGNKWYRFAVLCFCVYSLSVFICRLRSKSGKATRTIMNAGLILYVVFLLSTLVFSRPAGERSLIIWNKSFFLTAHGFHETSLLMVALKICVVVPFGAAIKKTFNKAPVVLLILAALLTGSIIECMKYFLGRGSAAIGSAVLLMASTLIGMCGESILNKLRKYRGEK